MQTFRLPVGTTDSKGNRYRDVELNSITGKEEELLAQYKDNSPNDKSLYHGAGSTSLLDLVLQRCLNPVGLGANSPDREEIIRGLSGQDRDYLLWELLRQTFGDRVQATIACTRTGCGKPVDIDFLISDYTRGIFTGEEGVDTHLDLEVHCPECDHVFQFPFYLPGFFLNRLRTGLNVLYHEVHILAYHYHWSESEILEMPREKRKMYIGMLAAEIEWMKDIDSSSFPPAVSGPVHNHIMPGIFPGPFDVRLEQLESIQPVHINAGESPGTSSLTGIGVPNGPNGPKEAGSETETETETVYMESVQLDRGKPVNHSSVSTGDLVHVNRGQNEQKETGRETHEITPNPINLTDKKIQKIPRETRKEKRAGEEANEGNEVNEYDDYVEMYTNITEIRLPGQVTKPMIPQPDAVQDIPEIEMKRSRVQPLQMKKNNSSKPGVPVSEESFIPLPEINRPRVQRLGFIQPSPSFPGKRVEENDREEKQRERRAPAPPVRQEVVRQVYMPPASSTPSAFWERMFLGHFHLKFFR